MSNSGSNQKLKIGDVVKLKSGGPDMTVNGFGSDAKTLQCVWFSGKHFEKVESYYFPPDALQLVVVKPHKKGEVFFKGKS